MPSAPPKLLYVAPRFPCVSLVFEQNEILGLVRAGADLRVLACRRPTSGERRDVHFFARPILELVVYPSFADTVRGLCRAVAERPRALARIFAWLTVAARNPFAFPKVLGAFMLGVGWYWQFSRDDYGWVHADFAQNSATAALFLAELLGTPFSFKAHAFDIFSRRLGFRDPLRAVKVQTAHVIFSEHEYGRQLLARLVPQSRSKTVINYSSVRTDDFLPLPPAEGSARFVALGRLVPKKGFEILVRAAACMRDHHRRIAVEVYGEGPESGHLTDLIKAHGLEGVVSLGGSYENGRLPSILRDATALVVPSVVTATGDMDGVPTVIYEAMALGRPVVASAISGIPEVVQDGVTGVLVEPGDPKHLADAMAALLAAPDAARSFGAEARRHAEQSYDYRTTARAMLRGIAGAVNGGAKRDLSIPSETT